MSKVFYRSMAIVGVLLAGLILGFLLHNPVRKALFGGDCPPHETSFEVSHQRGYRYINPLLDFEQQYKGLPHVKSEINDYIAKNKKDGRLRDISVYFRQLNTGLTFSINDDFKFSPASLLKVPLMIACLKQAEIDGAFLSKRIKFDIIPDSLTVPNFRYGEPIEYGKTYTVEELIIRLIINSDNHAGMLLLENLDSRILEKVYTDLDVAMPWLPGMENYMTVKEYSKFIRILFNSTYLNRDMSEFALYIMSLSHFDKGIVQGVGQGITVSHKFGERDIDGVRQLHDCGIIYFESAPCLICIMTRGNNFEELEDVIADIASIIKKEVDTQRQNGK